MASSLHQPQAPPAPAAAKPSSGLLSQAVRTPEPSRGVVDRTATRILQTALDLLGLPV